MTRDDLVWHLSEVARHAAEHDDEDAHAAEDRLRDELLVAIARGTLDGITPAEAAELALGTGELSFARWYA